MESWIREKIGKRAAERGARTRERSVDHTHGVQMGHCPPSPKCWLYCASWTQVCAVAKRTDQCTATAHELRKEPRAGTHNAVTLREGCGGLAKVEKVPADVDPARLVVVWVELHTERLRRPLRTRLEVSLTCNVLRLRDRLVVDVASRGVGLALR